MYTYIFTQNYEETHEWMNFSLQFNYMKTLVLDGPKGKAIAVGTADSFEKSCISLKKLFHDLRFEKL